ncbi:MAG: hypothetical protein ACOYN3_09105, partial [Acidimicrobiia bacterium]
GLYVAGPVGAPHPMDCCAIRSSGLNAGIGGHPQPLGVLQRAQLGDIETLVTIGTDPFGGAGRALEREALEGVRVHLHIGTIGSDALPVRGTRVVVLPGNAATRIGEIIAAVTQRPADVDWTTSPGLVQHRGDDRYAFVARALGSA